MNFKKAIIFGDVHGQFGPLYSFIKHKIDIYDDLATVPIFQLGDFGIWAHALHEGNKHLKKICENHQIYFLRGNHEEYTREGKPYFSDYTNVIVPKWFSDFKNIPIFLENHIVFNDIPTLWVGGGFSIDWQYRKEGRTLWTKEELPDLKVISSHIQAQLKPKIILTHDAPETFVNRYMGHRLSNARDQNNTIKNGSSELNILYNEYQPEWWFFGHYHMIIQKTDDRTGTKFIGFPIFEDGYGIYDFETNDLKLVE